jgi:polysaccharide export outer membrane protein
MLTIRPNLWNAASCVLICALILGLQVMSGYAQTNSLSGNVVTPQDMMLGAGDLLDVTVLDTPDLSAKARVSNDGTVSLPLVGVVPVAGMTIDQAGAAIENQLRSEQILNQPHVSVAISEYVSNAVTVTGEVRNPGVYPLISDHSVLDFISGAGGTTPGASRTIVLLRRDAPTSPITLQMSNDPQDIAKLNVPVKAGDRIIVTKGGVIYVVGDVGRAGGFLVEGNKNLSVLQAMALAQGANHTARLDKSVLISEAGNSRSDTPLPLSKILAGKAPDPILHDGDIVFVPTSNAKNWGYRGIEAAIAAATGIAIYVH